MLEPSPRLKKEAKRIGCDANHIIMADLILSGYTEAEAFDIAYSERTAAGVQQKIAERERVLASDGYKRAYEDRRQSRKVSTEDTEVRDKTAVARELNQLITNTTDQKLKAELLMKLADLQQMKKDTTADDDDPVQFYFPMSCEKCPLLQRYNEMLERNNDGVPREKWDLEVRPDEMQRLIEQAKDDIHRMRAKEKGRKSL